MVRWCWAPAKLQFCTEQPLVQTVFSDHTHGHPLTVVQRLLCFVLCGLMRNWEMEHLSLGVCVASKLGWFMILPTAYRDSAEPRGNFRGVTGGSCSQSCSSLKPAALENWSEILGLFTTACALLYNIREPGWSLIKAIAAIEAQLLFGLRKMAKCQYRFFASLWYLTTSLKF